MSYDDKLDLILARLDAIEAKLAPAAAPATVPTDGLFRFVRPAVRNVNQWTGDMTSPDAEEAFQRAIHGVNWRGGYIADSSYDEAWVEIERLKAGDQKLVAFYLYLDPEFAGFGLLTGLFSPVNYDGASFGVNGAARASFAGYTIQRFIDEQILVSQSGGGASGDTE
jgi:hypothetical protein